MKMLTKRISYIYGIELDINEFIDKMFLALGRNGLDFEMEDGRSFYAADCDTYEIVGNKLRITESNDE